MSFTPTNAPSTFQRMMDSVLTGLSRVEFYLGDVLTFFGSVEDYLTNLQAGLEGTAASNPKLRNSKCSIAQLYIYVL